MNKVVLLVILVCVLWLPLSAKPVSKEEAGRYAVIFYSKYAPNKGISDFSVKDIYVNVYNNKNSFYTVVFNAGGFVIISADDTAIPVLGYSFSSPVEKNIKNPGLLQKFESYDRQIEHVRTLKTVNPEVDQMWAELKNKSLSKDLKAAGPLLNTTWDQEPIYNIYCPASTPAGCVAITMAQIMNYYKWPATGQGSHSYIPTGHPSYGKLTANFATANYDWAHMATKLTDASTQTEKEAIAKLVYHCGIAVEMDYDKDGSGAISSDVLTSLANYFNYDPQSLQLITFDINAQTQWLNLIKAEIDAGRPVYYDGSSKADGGHAWVCDGYDNTDKVHINWGWGGSYNGYFITSAMSPGTYNFNESNSIIIGIQKGNPAQDILWTKQASTFITASRGIRYISAVDKRVAWAVAYDGSSADNKVKEFTRTVNGGESWNSGQITLPSTINFESSMIFAIDGNTAWVPLFGPDGGGVLAKTSDGGKTWIKQETASFTAPDGFPNMVYFWDKDHGFCQGDPNSGYFEIYTTSDGGTTWNRVPQPNIPANQFEEYATIGYFDVVGDTIWFSTTKGRLFRSANRGQNWQVFSTPITDNSFEISFKNAQTGIIQIRKENDYSAYITHNGGETWTSLSFTGKFYNNDFTFVPGTNLLITTGSDYTNNMAGISYSLDEGKTFNSYAPFYNYFQFLALGASDKNGIWAGSFSSNAYKNGMWHLGDIPLTSLMSADKNDICVASNVNITDASTGSPETWTWDFGEGSNPPTGTGQGPFNVNYTTDGLKSVTLTTTKGAETHQYINESLIRVAAGTPGSPGSISGNSTVSAGQKYSYSVNDLPNVTFKWKMPTTRWTGSSTTNSIQVSFSSYAKTDTLRVYAQNGCGLSDTSVLRIVVTGSLGVEPVANSNDYIVYPNPSKDKIFIKNVKNSTIEIINIEGKPVLQKKIISEQDALDISKLPSGIYYIKIPDKERNVYKPFSKF